MKKKVSIMLTTIAAFILFIPSILAASEPTYDMAIDYGDGKIGTQFFANGNPVTIEERTDGQEGALIKWNGGEYAVSPYSTVFGGSHNNATKLDTTNITMNGGTLRNIFGGGLHESYVGTASVTINGGTVTGGVQGGGASSYNKTTCHRLWFTIEENKEDATTVVDDAIVTINGGNLSDVFGGGEGISYTKSVSLVVNDGNISGYLTGSGSNGFTDYLSVQVDNGTIGIMQSVNRGKVLEGTMIVNNGTIGNIYVGAEPGDTSASNQLGRAEEVSLYVYGGVVTNVSAGNYGGNAAIESADTTYTVLYNEDSVKNVNTSEFEEGNAVPSVIFTFSFEGYGESIPIPKGTTFTQDEVNELMQMLNSGIAEDGLEVEGFYVDSEFKTKLDLTKPINDDTIAYIKVKEINNKPTDDGKTEVIPPKTSDINMPVMLGMIMLAVVGAAFALRKRLARINK